MKKLIVLFLIVGLGAGAYWWLQKQPKGEPPGVAAELSAKHTMAVVGAERLQESVQDIFEALAQLPEELTKELGPASAFIKDPAQRKAMIGFDPASAEGWAELGVDPAAGLSLVFDNRWTSDGDEIPGAVVLAKITSKDNLLKWLGERAPVKVEWGEGSPAELKVDGELVAYVGQKGAYTAFMPGPEPILTKNKAAFEGFLAGSGDLPGHSPFSRSAGHTSGMRLFTYGDGAALLSFLKGLPEDSAPDKKQLADFEFFLTRFIGAGGWVGQHRSAGRIVTSQQGGEILAKLVVPSAKPPQFSAYFPPADWAVGRVSVNIKDFLDGVKAILPPSMEEQRSAVSMAPMALGFIGLSMSDFTDALSGHAAFGGNMVSVAKMAATEEFEPTKIDALLLVGVLDAGKTESLVKKLIELATKGMPDLKIDEAKVGGATAWSVEVMGFAVTAAIDGDVLLLGPRSSVEAGLSRKQKKEGLHAGEVRDALDGKDVVYALSYDLKSLKGLAGDFGMDAEVVEKMLAKQKTEIVAALRVDRNGLFWRSSSIGYAQTVGILAAVAIPAFVKYIERSKSAALEHEVRIKQMQDEMQEQLRAVQAGGELDLPGAVPVELGAPADVEPDPPAMAQPEVGEAANDDVEAAAGEDEAPKKKKKKKRKKKKKKKAEATAE